MNKKLATIVLLTTTINLFSQTLKTFNGKYEDGTVNKGTATYTYYEDTKTSEYIKHGNFKYTYAEKNDISSYIIIINGNYKNNKKDGLWSYNMSVVDWPSNGEKFISGTKTLTSNFLNGKPNGSWIFKYDAKAREKRFSALGFTWTNYETMPSQSVSASFNNGALSGQFQLSNTLIVSDFNTITGQFNSNGFMLGSWVFKGPKEEKTMEFKNGVLVKYILRELSTGKVLEKEIDDENMTRIKNSFIEGKDIKEDLVKYKIKIDTINAVTERYYDFIYSFKLEDFRFKYISGDDSYNYTADKYSFAENRNEGTFIYFNQTKTYKLSELEEYKLYLEEIGNEMYSRALISLNNIKGKYWNNLSESDLSIVEQKLKECEAEVSKEKNKQKAVDSYNSLFEFKTMVMPNQDEEDLKIINMLLGNNTDAFSEIQISKLKEKRGVILKKKESSNKSNDKREKRANNITAIKANHEKLIQLYKAKQDGYTRYTASKKSKLFTHYDDIYNQYMNNGYQNTDDFINDFVLVQERMMYYAENDSQAIEKLLKETESVDDKIKIFKSNK